MLVIILTSVWAFAIIAPAFVKSYQPPPEVSAAFPAIIGAVLAIPAKGNGNRENGDKE